MQMIVPVVDRDGKSLMPTNRKRAEKLIATREATYFFSHGIFCIRLNREPSARNMQKIVVGVDPGAKREGYSVRSEKHDFLNIDANAKDWVGVKIQKRRMLRRSRRNRKTPYRHRKTEGRNQLKRVPAGVKARWEEKLRVLNWLSKLYPITNVIIENVTAITRKGKRGWNTSFSAVQSGKEWLYSRVREKWILGLVDGFETYRLRNKLGLEKTKDKLADLFSAHCVDAWVLASVIIGGTKPKHERIHRLVPIQRQRRQLHLPAPLKGGLRKPYGGTNKSGLKTGTLVKRKNKWYYTNGTKWYTNPSGSVKELIRLSDLRTGKRIVSSLLKNLEIKRPLSWRFYTV